MEDKNLKFEAKVAQTQLNETLNNKKEKENQILNNMEKICKNYLNNNVDFVNKVARYLPETFYYTDIDSLNNCIRIELNINNQNYFFAFNQNLYNIILKGEKNIKAKGSLPESLYNEIYNKVVAETNNIDNFINEDGDIFYSIIIKNFNDNKILFGNSKSSVVKNINNIKLYMLNIMNKLISGNDNKKEFNQKLFDTYQRRKRVDFSLELYSGVSGLSDETSIEIFSYDMNAPQVFNINVNGKNYNEQTYLFENVKSLVSNHLDKFIIYSKNQNKEFLSEYASDEGTIIHITYGNLNIHLIPTAHEDMCNVIYEFENILKSLFFNNNIY